MLNKTVSVFSVFAILMMLCAVCAQARGNAGKQSRQPPAALYLPQPDYVYNSAGKRDPFIPLINGEGRYVQLERNEEEIEASVLKLEGIIFDRYGLSYAIVDGVVVKVGDQISDYTVLSIEEKKVVFIREGQIKEVLLKKED